jgi:hypothetical protein
MQWELKIGEQGIGEILGITPLFPDADTRRNKKEECEKRENWMYLVLEATAT